MKESIKMINGSVSAVSLWETSLLDLAGWGYWVIVSPFIVMGVAFILLLIFTGILAWRKFYGS